MADSLGELLSMKQWLRAHDTKVLYTTTPTAETPPASGSATVPVDVPDGKVQPQLYYRFAQVRALDGDLLVRLKQAGDTAPAATPGAMGEGELRVLNGTAEWYQITNGTVLYIQTVTGTANGTVNWAR